MLSNAAVTKAKSYFKLNQVNIIWKSVCFEAKELFQHIFDYVSKCVFTVRSIHVYFI